MRISFVLYLLCDCKSKTYILQRHQKIQRGTGKTLSPVTTSYPVTCSRIPFFNKNFYTRSLLNQLLQIMMDSQPLQKHKLTLNSVNPSGAHQKLSLFFTQLAQVSCSIIIEKSFPVNILNSLALLSLYVTGVAKSYLWMNPATLFLHSCRVAEQAGESPHQGRQTSL